MSHRSFGGFFTPLLMSIVIVGCGTRPSHEPTGPSGQDAQSIAAADPYRRPATDAVIGLLPGGMNPRVRELIAARARQLGARVIVPDAAVAAQSQIEQSARMLQAGATALVVIPDSAASADEVVRTAHLKRVAVIFYDRLIGTGSPDAYITLDPIRTGELQAQAMIERVPRGKYLVLGGDPGEFSATRVRAGQMKSLQPQIDAGDIRVVGDKRCKNGSRAEARRYAEEALAQEPELAAVLAADDTLAAGAIEALQAAGIAAGRVSVAGVGASVEACRSISRDLQTFTMYGPAEQIAASAAGVSVAFGRGLRADDAWREAGPYAQYSETNLKPHLIPTFGLVPVVVHKQNLDETVIASGFRSRAEIYAE